MYYKPISYNNWKYWQTYKKNIFKSNKNLILLVIFVIMNNITSNKLK